VHERVVDGELPDDEEQQVRLEGARFVNAPVISAGVMIANIIW
jgi:hypothetical protein